jgi:hypothetical protein
MKSKKMVKQKDPYEVVRKEHNTLAELATERAKSIKSIDSLKDGVSFYRTIKEKEDIWLSLISPAVHDAHIAHKSIKNVEKELAQPLERARNEILRPAIRQFIVEYRKALHKKEDELRTDTGVELILPDGSKIEGVFTRMEYTPRVVSIKTLCQGIADGSVPEDAVLPNMVFLNKMAKNMKTMLNWQGIEVTETPDITIRTNGNGGYTNGKEV